MEKGITLLEMIVVIAIISTLSLIGVNTIDNFRKEAELESSVNEFVTELKSARNKSMAGEIPEGKTADDFDSDGLPVYGIEVTGGSYSLFRNYIYSDATNIKDLLESIELSSDLTLTPETSVSFKRISGDTTPTSFTIQRNSGAGKTINISENGFISISDL